MAAITILREYGSRGAAIGALVGERLGWRYVDDGLTFLLAYRAGIPVESLRAYDQEAFSRLRTRDRAVARYLRHFYHVDRGARLLYLVVLNTETLTVEEGACLILQAAPAETESASRPQPAVPERDSRRAATPQAQP